MDSANMNNTEIQVSFNTVLHIVKNRQITISKNGQANLKRSIHFLDTVIQSINSLGKYSEQNNMYYFVPNLKEMINISKSDYQEISKDKIIEESKNYFSKVKSNLELLQQDPRKLYSSPDVDSLKDTLSKILDIYSEVPHIVEGNFTLSGGFCKMILKNQPLKLHI
jgi:hypothetical protein